MRIVYSSRHQLHDPDFELTGGHRIPGYEVPRRAEAIREALEPDAAFTFGPPRSFGI